MARAAVNGRWQAEMAEFFTDLDGLPPDQGIPRVAEVFHLRGELGVAAGDKGGQEDLSRAAKLDPRFKKSR